MVALVALVDTTARTLLRTRLSLRLAGAAKHAKNNGRVRRHIQLHDSVCHGLTHRLAHVRRVLNHTPNADHGVRPAALILAADQASSRER